MSRSPDTPTAPPRGGWLCPTEEDRNRLVDMSPAVTRARRRFTVVVGLGVIAIGPWLGWLPVVFFAIGAGPLLFLDHFMGRSRRPERYAASVQLFSFLLVLSGAAVTGGEHSPVTAWLALPLIAAAARFRMRVFVGAVALTSFLTITVLGLVSPAAVLADPAPLICLGVLIVGFVVLQQPVLDAENRWRRDAVLDPLTGLLNRQGLDRRFVELSEQARLVDAPVSIVLFDIDHFKGVNDTYGHARGDDVLVGVGDTLRRQLRSFELLYRLGGDELLLLLPGAEHEDALGVAEQARLAVLARRPGELDVTVSAGVSTGAGEALMLDEMLAEADGWMYEAKRAGGNAVRGSEPASPPAPPSVVAA